MHKWGVTEGGGELGSPNSFYDEGKLNDMGEKQMPTTVKVLQPVI